MRRAPDRGPRGRVFASLATSLDGYIASSAGDMQWLNDAMQPGEDYGFAEKTKRTGAYILGANTFRETVAMGGTSTSTPTFVMTHEAPERAPRGVEFCDGAAADVVERAKAATDKDVWIFGGGDVVTQMLASDVVDELELAVVPVALGGGVPLFRPLELPVRLRLSECRSYPSGIVMLRYERNPAADEF